MDYSELVKRTGGPAGKASDHLGLLILGIVAYVSLPFFLIYLIFWLLSLILG
jgi:hypothetical protein